MVPIQFLQSALAEPEVVAPASIGGVLAFTYFTIKTLLGEMKSQRKSTERAVESEREVRRLEADARIADSKANDEMARTMAAQNMTLQAVMDRVLRQPTGSD